LVMVDLDSDNFDDTNDNDDEIGFIAQLAQSREATMQDASEPVGNSCWHCSNPLTTSMLVACVGDCDYKAHVTCCAQQLLAPHQLVPVQGRVSVPFHGRLPSPLLGVCPACATPMVWGDVVRRVRLRQQGKILKRTDQVGDCGWDL
jgi:hypothetical protein